MTDVWKRRIRIALLLLGASLLCFSIYRTGPLVVLAAAKQALPYLPLIVCLNLSFYLLEALAHRTMLGEARGKVGLALGFRTTLSSYVANMLLPLGRAGAEVARTAAYAPFVGAPKATAASATFQVPAFFGTAVLGFFCATMAGLSLGFSSKLAVVLFLHALGSTAAGFVFALATGRFGMGKLSAKLVPSLAASAAAFDEAAKVSFSSYARATGYCVLARVVELLQSGAILVALGVSISLGRVAICSGVHIVGGTLGEAIPSQLGALEGAYLYFAESLGLAADPARALSIPLLVRLTYYVIGAFSLAYLHLTSAEAAARELGAPAVEGTE